MSSLDFDLDMQMNHVEIDWRQANLLERRWFSSIAAARAAQAECDVLRGVMELAESAWRCARTQLAEIEALRDRLGDELAALDECEGAPPPITAPAVRRVMSVA